MVSAAVAEIRRGPAAERSCGSTSPYLAASVPTCQHAPHPGRTAPTCTD